MSEGYVYFATTFPGYVKAGRFGVNLSAQEKERQYRTLVPEFKVHHAYYDPDAKKEEKRILAMLRLIAESKFDGAGRENFKLPLEKAIAVAKVQPRQLQELARKAIYDLRLGHKTVAELLKEMNDNMRDTVPAKVALRRNGEIRTALRAAGLTVNSARPDQELSVNVYGFVLDEKMLIAAIPELKVCHAVLPGMTF